MLIWSLGKKLDENPKIKWNYQTDGYDHSGVKIPDFPILNLLIEKPTGEKISGPAIIDTGFDGSLFANEALTFFLADVPKEDEKIIFDKAEEEHTDWLYDEYGNGYVYEWD